MNSFKITQKFAALDSNAKKGLNRTLILSRFSFLFFMFFYSSTSLISQTLCNQYGSGSFTYVVGTGSPGNILNSSQLGTSLPVGATVYVIGDFTVDDNFILTNAIVKVNGGAKISVLNSNFNWNGISFTLNNTKVFACNSLWKGIMLGGLCNISMSYSTIEDAETAISAIDVNFSSLYLNSNTFNRNKVGINLDATNSSGGWWAVPPTLNYFVNNTFSCTSPLNTIGGQTEYGLLMKDVSYPLAYNYGNELNEFKGLQNGIYIAGGFCNFTMYRYKFSNNTLNDVYFLGKNLTMQLCVFSDIRKNGLVSYNSEQLVVENSFFKILDESSSSKKMIECKPSGNGNYTRIDNNTLYNLGKNSVGIDYNGDTYTNAEISNNSFFHFGLSSGYHMRGIIVIGPHSTQSSMTIFNNSFNFDNDYGMFGSVGSTPDNIAIYSLGTRNNFKIISNDIESGYGRTAFLIGSTGINNEFSENTWNIGADNFLVIGGIKLEGFHNMKICSNINHSAAYPTFDFRNANLSTNFTNNVHENDYWGSSSGAVPAINISGSFATTPLIDVQDHKGNKWQHIEGLTSPHSVINYANSPAAVALSQFRVHTTQPTEFFPEYVDNPNAPGSDFFVNSSGTPSFSCILQSPNIADGGSVLDPLIAQARLSDYIQNTAQVYDAELHLMRKIKKNPSSYNSNQMYKNFLQRHQGKNKEKIINIEDAIDENTKINDNSKNKILKFKDEIKVLEDNNKKYNKDNRPTKDEMKTFFQKRLELDKNIDALNKEHKTNKKFKDKEAKNIADNIVPTTLQERLTKEVYQIYLDAQINNDGIFTEAQRSRMKQIAATCFNEGGMIVYVARGFLSMEDYFEILKQVEICEQDQSFETPFLTKKTIQTQAVKRNVVKPTVFPNPSKESITISLTKDITGNADFIDLTGKLISTHKLNSGENTLIHNLSSGIYILNIKTSDGQINNQKLTVNN